MLHPKRNPERIEFQKARGVKKLEEKLCLEEAKKVSNLDKASTKIWLQDQLSTLDLPPSVRLIADYCEMIGIKLLVKDWHSVLSAAGYLVPPKSSFSSKYVTQLISKEKILLAKSTVVATYCPKALTKELLLYFLYDRNLAIWVDGYQQEQQEEEKKAAEQEEQRPQPRRRILADAITMFFPSELEKSSREYIIAILNSVIAFKKDDDFLVGPMLDVIHKSIRALEFHLKRARAELDEEGATKFVSPQDHSYPMLFERVIANLAAGGFWVDLIF